MKNKILPPKYFLLFLVLLIGLHFIFPVTKIIYAPYNWLALLFIIFGIVINLWADNMFKKAKTTVKPNKEPTALITSGPFCLTRHPMYLGMAAILLGASVFLGSLITLIFPIIFIFLMQIIFIPSEEKDLEAAFGQKYREYKKKVRCWI